MQRVVRAMKKKGELVRGARVLWAGELVTALNRSVRAALIARWHGRELVTWTLEEELSQERSSPGRALSRSVPTSLRKSKGHWRAEPAMEEVRGRMADYVGLWRLKDWACTLSEGF